jgi:hypothetical protein
MELAALQQVTDSLEVQLAAAPCRDLSSVTKVCTLA